MSDMATPTPARTKFLRAIVSLAEGVERKDRVKAFRAMRSWGMAMILDLKIMLLEALRYPKSYAAMKQAYTNMVEEYCMTEDDTVFKNPVTYHKLMWRHENTLSGKTRRYPGTPRLAIIPDTPEDEIRQLRVLDAVVGLMEGYAERVPIEVHRTCDAIHAGMYNIDTQDDTPHPHCRRRNSEGIEEDEIRGWVPDLDEMDHAFLSSDTFGKKLFRSPRSVKLKAVGTSDVARGPVKDAITNMRSVWLTQADAKPITIGDNGMILYRYRLLYDAPRKYWVPMNRQIPFIDPRPDSIRKGKRGIYRTYHGELVDDPQTLVDTLLWLLYEDIAFSKHSFELDGNNQPRPYTREYIFEEPHTAGGLITHRLAELCTCENRTYEIRRPNFHRQYRVRFAMVKNDVNERKPCMLVDVEDLKHLLASIPKQFQIRWCRVDIQNGIALDIEEAWHLNTQR